MSPVCEIEFPQKTQLFFVSPLSDSNVRLEEESESAPHTTFAHDSDWLFPGMVSVPQDIRDVIVNQLRDVPHVKAILMGRSGEVHHVWTMLDEWTAMARKAVYAAQKDLLLKLKGFELDFYVVSLDEGEDPQALVSEIPVVWPRTA
jgi:hypothetical protein